MIENGNREITIKNFKKFKSKTRKEKQQEGERNEIITERDEMENNTEECAQKATCQESDNNSAGLRTSSELCSEAIRGKIEKVKGIKDLVEEEDSIEEDQIIMNDEEEGENDSMKSHTSVRERERQNNRERNLKRYKW